ncbi:recombinase family protein [Amycolatopsis pigmentata]|uniref:Recombinase family protein n=1 Tax=Amycolatopsis pigmentata TaxID=450801 RepID=A0ABW5G1X1_9PSEU
MPTNHTPDQPDGEAARRAATSKHRFRAPRWASRMLCPHPRTINDRGEPDARHPGQGWPVRQRVLREYHAINLTKARQASEEMVRAGYNTGAIPYGYRAQRVRVTPVGRKPRWRTRLVIEPVEAATVKMLFAWRAEDGLTIAEIHRRLTAARYPAPLKRHTGQPGRWSPEVIKSILRNPKYQGRQVWGRRCHGKLTPRAQWVWSPAWAHPPIVSAELFTAANQRTGPAR